MNNREMGNLISCIKNGDEQAFNVFYEKTYKGVFSFIYSYVNNWHTAEDLLQETYIKVKTNLDKVANWSNVNAWVLQIAKNTCLDYLRKDKKECFVELDEQTASVGDEFSDKLYIHELINKNFEEQERQIIILHILYGYKNREMAKILQMPLGTVLWKYNKAIKKLKDLLKKEEEGCE